MIRVLIVSAAAFAFALPAVAADVPAAARAVMARANADWLPAMQAKDAQRIAEPYAEDGVFVLPNGQTIVGRKTIAEFYARQLGAGRRIVKGGIHTDGVGAAADGLVIEWGHGGATSLDAAGKETTTNGPYMTVWKKGADGRWAIVRNLIF